MRDLLTDGEYQAARDSTINAHYTAPAITRAMWDAMEAFGYEGGRVLEAGCGTGNFIRTAPRGTAVTGIEKDPLTAAIADALCTSARIRCEDFTRTDIRPGTFDAAIGNVPFGAIHLYEPGYNPQRRDPVHTHFIRKALDGVRPGGLAAFITSRHTMDATGAAAEAARRDLAAAGELLAAVRLPSNAHRRTAGTAVVTDVLVFRRYRDDEQPPDTGPDWTGTVTVNAGGHDIPVSRHFAGRPDMVLGTLAAGGARRGDDLQVLADDGSDTAAELARALAAAAAEREQEAAPPPRPQIPPGIGKPPEGLQQALPDGTFARYADGDWRPFTPPGSDTARDELRELLGLRDTALELLDAELATTEDAGRVDQLRARLNARYDAYTDVYGPVNRYTPQIRVRPGPAGRALREEMLADGRAVLAGGTFEILDPAARGELTAARHAFTDEDGTLRHRQTKNARTARQRLIDAGRARLTGQSLKITEAGRTWIEANIDSLDDAVSIARIRPTAIKGFRNDPYAARVQALEKYDPETRTAVKRDIMRHRILKPRELATRADSPGDALAICMDRYAAVRLDVIAGLLGAPGEDEARTLLGDLVYTDPATGRLAPAAEYLSGDVREKLRIAEAAAETSPAFTREAEALRAVIPEDVGPADISARLGAVFIHPGEVEQFLKEILLDDTVSVTQRGGKWSVAGDKHSNSATITWGTTDKDALTLAEHLLNRGAPIEVTRTVDGGGTVLDEEATTAAREKEDELSDKFAGWIWEDLDRARDVCRRYNGTFNSTVLRSYDDVRIEHLPGLNKDIKLFWWQKAAIARMIYEPTALLGHDMGAGKTLEQIIGAMEQKRLGLIRKPVFVVKNHLLEQFAAEFLWAYPQARIMCADGPDLSGDGRRQFLARAGAENPDAIILTQRGFEAIPLTPGGHEDYLAYMEDLFQDYLEAEEHSVKDQVTLLTEFREKLRAYFDPDYGKDDEDGDDEEEADTGTKKKGAKRKAKRRIEQDPAMCWEHIGADYLLIDESQDYNNLWVPSPEPGMAIGFTHRSVDLEMKLHAMRARYGDRVATFATGTAVTNKIPQFYVLMRYLNPARLIKAGFIGYTPWAATYTEPETRLEMKASGQFGLATRHRLINIPELLLDLHAFADFKDADDIGLERPEIRGGKPEILGVDGPDELYDWQATLPERYDNARTGGRKKQPGDDTVVAVLGDGFRAAQDLRLVRPRHGETPDPATGPQKIDYIADDIFAEWAAHRDDAYPADDGSTDPVRGSLQVVFCNEGVPRADRWNLYHELRDQLAARGMPRSKIKFIHDAADSGKKADLFASCNAGHVAVLVSSTEKGGVGANFQRRCIGVHHVHPHWRPDYGAQEDARARRPGNLNTKLGRPVFLKWWITEGSFDTTRAQAMERKSQFLRVIKHRDPSVRTLEVPGDDQVSYSAMFAIGAREPRLLEKHELESKVRQLARAQRRHFNEQNDLKVSAQQAQALITSSRKAIEAIDDAAPRIPDLSGGKFAMTVDGRRLTARRDAGDRLHQLMTDTRQRNPAGTSSPLNAGTLAGFPVTVSMDASRLTDDITLTLEGLPGGQLILDHRKLPGGPGLISRLENRLGGLPRLRARHQDTIARQEKQAARARAALGTPFPQQETLTAAKASLNALIEELRTDKDKDDGKGKDSKTTSTTAQGPEHASPPEPDWTATHPLGEQISRMRAAASADTGLLQAAAGGPAAGALQAFRTWAGRYTGTEAGPAGLPGPDTDPVLAADVLATLASSLAQDGTRTPPPDAIAADPGTAAAVKADAAGTGPAPPADRDPDLAEAIGIAVRLSRDGMPASQRRITWDPAAGTYVITAELPAGTCRMPVPPGNHLFRVTAPGGHESVTSAARGSSEAPEQAAEAWCDAAGHTAGAWTGRHPLHAPIAEMRTAAASDPDLSKQARTRNLRNFTAEFTAWSGTWCSGITSGTSPEHEPAADAGDLKALAARFAADPPFRAALTATLAPQVRNDCRTPAVPLAGGPGDSPDTQPRAGNENPGPPRSTATGDLPGQTAAPQATKTAQAPGTATTQPGSWTARHPHAGSIAALRDEALGNTTLAAARQMPPGDFTAALGETLARWAGKHCDTGRPAGDLARQLRADPSFRADLTATLASQARRAPGAGDPEPLPDGDLHPGAVREATETWSAIITQARAEECGCMTGCPACELPSARLQDLQLAVETDMHLARAGIPRHDRCVTWDPDPGTYTATAVTGTGHWKLLPAAGSGAARPGHAGNDSRCQAVPASGPPVFLAGSTPGETVRSFLAGPAGTGPVPGTAGEPGAGQGREALPAGNPAATGTSIQDPASAAGAGPQDPEPASAGTAGQAVQGKNPGQQAGPRGRQRDRAGDTPPPGQAPGDSAAVPPAADSTGTPPDAGVSPEQASRKTAGPEPGSAPAPGGQGEDDDSAAREHRMALIREFRDAGHLAIITIGTSQPDSELPGQDQAGDPPGPEQARVPAARTGDGGSRDPGAGTAPAARQRRQPRPEDVHDYTKLVRSQRARLQEAVDSNDPRQVLDTCRAAVTAWNLPGNCWPPDTSPWQDALAAFPGLSGEDGEPVLLEDLAEEPVPDPADEDQDENEPLSAASWALPQTLFDVAPEPEEHQQPPAPGNQAAAGTGPQPGAARETPAVRPGNHARDQARKPAPPGPAGLETSSPDAGSDAPPAGKTPPAKRAISPRTTPPAQPAADGVSPDPGTGKPAIPGPEGDGMHFMNDAAIDEAADRYRNHPVLGPASRTLAGLRDWADGNGGDGWAAWPAPARAARKLMELIEGDDSAGRDTVRADATPDLLKAAYIPVKSLLTRENGPHSVIEQPPAAEKAGKDSPAAAPAAGTPAAGQEDGDGPFSRRITIGTDNGTTFITGTDFNLDPPELRRELNNAGFRWRKQRYRWEYTGKAARLDANTAKVRRILAELDAEYPDPAPADFTPTPQQQAIIDAVTAGQHVAVQALAGTGKTTTLTAVASALEQARPAATILYTAYNAAVIKDASQGRFGRNVTARTMHSLAKQALLNTTYAPKVTGDRAGARRPKQWAEVLGITSHRSSHGDPVEPDAIAAMVIAAMKRFRDSADPEPAARHLPHGAGGPLGKAVLDYARQAWDNILDPANAHLLESGQALLIDHDDYLKVWAVTNPEIDADVIMFDEAQDTNPCMSAVIQAQRGHAQTVVVGDSQQSIYSFRGAIDALRDWPADVTLPLTQSWRFGTDLAAFANLFLESLGSSLRLEGNPARGTVTGAVPVPDAILCRTNGTAIGELVTSLEAGKRTAFAGDRSEDLISFARGVRDLQRGRKAKHPELDGFSNWTEVREHARTEEGQHLQTLIRLTDKHGPDGLIDILSELTRENDRRNPPELTVSTAHQAKGREWNKVRVAGDFPGPENDPATGKPVLPAPEERRLQYVAATRAKEILDPGSLSWILGSTAETGQEPEPAQPAAEKTPAAPEPAAAQQARDDTAGPQPATAVPAASSTQPEPASSATAGNTAPEGTDPLEALPSILVNSASWAIPPGITVNNGWVIAAAVRPLAGTVTWGDQDSPPGLWFAAGPPDDAIRHGWEDTGASLVKFTTNDEITGRIARYLAWPGPDPDWSPDTTLADAAADLALPWDGETSTVLADLAPPPAGKQEDGSRPVQDVPLPEADEPAPAEPDGSLGTLLDTIGASDPTRAILRDAAAAGLHPHLNQDKPSKGRWEIMIAGQDLSGVIHVSPAHGRILRGILARGSSGDDRTYEGVKAVRAVIRGQQTPAADPGTGQADLFTAPPGSPAGQDNTGNQRESARRIESLHHALAILAAAEPGFAATPDGPGLTAADTALGHLLADTPPADWAAAPVQGSPPPEATAAWLMLAAYAGQLTQAGINYANLPVPPGAGNRAPADTARIRDEARTRALRSRANRHENSAPILRCDDPAGPAVLQLLPWQASLPVAETAGTLPGISTDPEETATWTYPAASLPAAVALADANGIPVTPDARALSAVIAARPADDSAPRTQPDPAAAEPVPSPPEDPEQAARRLGHLPRRQVAGAVAALPGEELPGIRDILATHFPEQGYDYGPAAEVAYQECARRLGYPQQPPAALGAPGPAPAADTPAGQDQHQEPARAGTPADSTPGEDATGTPEPASPAAGAGTPPAAGTQTGDNRTATASPRPDGHDTGTAGRPGEDTSPPAPGTGDPEPGTGPAPASPGPLTGEDIAAALRRLHPAELAALAEDETTTVTGASRRTLGDGTSCDITWSGSGAGIAVTGPAGPRQGQLSWPQLAGWLAPGLTLPRRRLLATAARASGMYRTLASGYCAPGTGPHRDVTSAAEKLAGIARDAAGSVITAALETRTAAALPAGQETGTAPRAQEDTGTGTAQDHVDALTGILPAWPPRWNKPAASITPGDILRGHPGHPGKLLTVTAAARDSSGTITITGTLHGTAQPAATWTYPEGGPPAAAEIIPPGGPLAGPVPGRSGTAGPAAGTPDPSPAAASQEQEPGHASPDTGTEEPMALPPGVTGHGTPRTPPEPAPEPSAGPAQPPAPATPEAAAEQFLAGQGLDPAPEPAPAAGPEAGTETPGNSAAPGDDIVPVVMTARDASTGNLHITSAFYGEAQLEQGTGDSQFTRQDLDYAEAILNGHATPPAPAEYDPETREVTIPGPDRDIGIAIPEGHEDLARCITAAASQGVPAGTEEDRGGNAELPGIQRLAADEPSGGTVRPARRLYGDGTEVDVRPDPQSAGTWRGTAAGAVTAAAPGRGRLQVIRDAGGTRHIAPPALVSPAGTDPYQDIAPRQARRFRRFDAAEAAGADSAMIPAAHIDEGDRIRITAGPGTGSPGKAETRIVAGTRITSNGAVAITMAPRAGQRRSETRSVPWDTRVEALCPARHPAQDGPHAGRLFTETAVPGPGEHGGRDAPAPGTQPAADQDAMQRIQAKVTRLGGIADSTREQADEFRDIITSVQADLDQLAASVTRGPGGDRDGNSTRQDWERPLAQARKLQAARREAVRQSPELAADPDWKLLSTHITRTRRLAADARRGTVRVPGARGGLRAWNRIWGGICRASGALAARQMSLAPDGSRAWNAARRLHHASAEGFARSRGWLPRKEQLPLGSYETPAGYTAPVWAKADAATRLHDKGAGPLSDVTFPGGPLDGAVRRYDPGKPGRARPARRAAAARQPGAAEAPSTTASA